MNVIRFFLFSFGLALSRGVAAEPAPSLSPAARVYNDGSQAGTRTFLFMMPQKKFAICLMTNLQRADCETLTPTIREVALK